MAKVAISLSILGSILSVTLYYYPVLTRWVINVIKIKISYLRSTHKAKKRPIYIGKGEVFSDLSELNKASTSNRYIFPEASLIKDLDKIDISNKDLNTFAFDDNVSHIIYIECESFKDRLNPLRIV